MRGQPGDDPAGRPACDSDRDRFPRMRSPRTSTSPMSEIPPVRSDRGGRQPKRYVVMLAGLALALVAAGCSRGDASRTRGRTQRRYRRPELVRRVPRRGLSDRDPGVGSGRRLVLVGRGGRRCRRVHARAPTTGPTWDVAILRVRTRPTVAWRIWSACSKPRRSSHRTSWWHGPPPGSSRVCSPLVTPTTSPGWCSWTRCPRTTGVRAIRLSPTTCARSRTGRARTRSSWTSKPRSS